MFNSTTGNPTPIGKCLECANERFLGLTHQCITTPVWGWVSAQVKAYEQRVGNYVMYKADT